MNRLNGKQVRLVCRDLVSAATAIVSATHQFLGCPEEVEPSFMSLANSGALFRLFCCPSSPTGKIYSIAPEERESVRAQMKEWMLEEDGGFDGFDFGFDDIIPIFCFAEAADVFFTVSSGRFRNKLLAWDHELGAPAEAVISNSFEEFVELVLRNPIALMESDIRFTRDDAANETLDEDAQLVAIRLEHP